MTYPPHWLREHVETGFPTWSHLVELVKIAQQELGVQVDGKPGRGTVNALLAYITRTSSSAKEEAPPIPKGRAGVKRVYGTFSWVPTKGRFVDIDDKWERQNIQWFELHTGQKRKFHKLAGEEFSLLYKKACEASGYTPDSVQTFVPRKIKATENSKLSYHTWGIAFDVDPRENPWGGKQKDGSPSLVRQHMEFVDVFEKAGWTWGGRWKDGAGDDMHFERKQ